MILNEKLISRGVRIFSSGDITSKNIKLTLENSILILEKFKFTNFKVINTNFIELQFSIIRGKNNNLTAENF